MTERSYAPPGQVTRYFSFGVGDTDPVTGNSLRDRYVTVVAPTADACRSGMLAMYGRGWSSEYAPGNARTDSRIALWSEHERITVVSVAGCYCPVFAAPEVRGDSADTIVHHVDGYCTKVGGE